MGYIRDLEAEVRKVLQSGADEDTIVTFFKDKVWESYKNGQKASKRPKKKTEPADSED